jgi:predicted transposase YbfD/YdcC
MVVAERRLDADNSRQTRYYLTSLPGDAATVGAAVRGHWGIENRLHWVLDSALREDDSRVRQGSADQNLAVLRRLALNLLRHDCGGLQHLRLPPVAFPIVYVSPLPTSS